jgi:hypothetical protein
VYFSGVLGISSDGSTFERPINYTPRLSGLVYYARLFILESTLPRFAHPYVGWKARPRHGQLALLNKVRVEKMCLGAQAPIGEFISLRSYGRSLSRSDGPSFRVHWGRDGQEIAWDEHRLSMSQFKDLSRSTLRSVVFSCNRLMYGWEPPCDLMNIIDKLSNTTSGYSFVSEPENGLVDAYLKLSSRACLASIDGLMVGDRWNHDTVFRYLAQQDELSKQLMLLIFLTGGQAARGTELLSIEHRNGPSTSRGVYVYAGAVAIISRHHKSRHITNNEFQVARFVPIEVSQLLYRYLVYIRPFSAMLHRICYNRLNVDTSLLFSSASRPNEVWKTSVLSKALQQCAKSVIGYEFGVKIYRQLSIAITEKHIAQISKPFNRYDDKGSEADINTVAFAWQSGHRPMRRGTSYGIDAAYPDSLQPALLQIYQWASNEWHSFIRLNDDLEPALLLRPAPSTSTSLESAGPHVQPGDYHTRHTSLPQDADNDKMARQQQLSTPASSSLAPRGGPHAQLPTPRSIINLDDLGHSDDPHGADEPLLWAMSKEIEHYHDFPKIPWAGYIPLFGHPNENDKAAVIEKQQEILSYLKAMESKESLNWRLKSIDKYFQQWKNVGCQLCYASTGRPEPDHSLRECKATRAQSTAVELAIWLEQLSLPRFSGGVGLCSLCIGTDYPCKEICLGIQISEQRSSILKNRLREERDSKHHPDGFCEIKPIVRDTIAALCTYDGQILGKTLAKRIMDEHAVDFFAENQVAFWFKQQASVPYGSHPSVPRILLVFEMLVLSYDFRVKDKSKEGTGQIFRMPPAQGTSLSLGMQRRAIMSRGMLPQGRELQLQRWKESLEWWIGKCSFCVGRGLHGGQINHTLGECKRGGAIYRRTGLGEIIYLEGFWVESGCRKCAAPHELCQRWKKCQDRTWERDESKDCQYRQLVYDTVIGIFHCADPKFRLELVCDIQDDVDGYHDLGDLEEVAVWLGTGVILEGVECARIMQQFYAWTKVLQKGKL